MKIKLTLILDKEKVKSKMNYALTQEQIAGMNDRLKGFGVHLREVVQGALSRVVIRFVSR